MGGPVDSIRLLTRQLESIVDRMMPGDDRATAELDWLARAASLAFPAYRLQSVVRLRGRGDYLIDAQAALLSGDSGQVRRILSDVQASRRLTRPADLMLDAVYPEAFLLAAIGDDRGAIAWLDPTLGSIAATAPYTLVDVTRAGALLRAMALRADLAQRVGDHETARIWARATQVLWSDADPFLQPLVERMERLAR
jgi:hypothetical protein